MNPPESKIPRRQAREEALQILYQLDMNHELTPEAGMYHFENHFSKPTNVDPFTQRLVSGISAKLAELDEKLNAITDNWRTDRMAVVDRNLLRLGAYEILYCDEIAATITINEMVEIAKHFGSESSPPFINGVLDKLKAGINNPKKTP